LSARRRSLAGSLLALDPFDHPPGSLVEFDEVTERVARVDDRILEHADEHASEGGLDGSRAGLERVRDGGDRLALGDEAALARVDVDQPADVGTDPGLLRVGDDGAPARSMYWRWNRWVSPISTVTVGTPVSLPARRSAPDGPSESPGNERLRSRS